MKRRPRAGGRDFLLSEKAPGREMSAIGPCAIAGRP